MTKVQENIIQYNTPVGNSSSLLGNKVSYSAKPIKRDSPATLKLKHSYKKANIERKKKIGKLVHRVSYCGTRPIAYHSKNIEAVEGEKGGIYYRHMQHCGSVWFCPDCMYKLMKGRADELYRQLKAYKEAGKLVLFITFTLQHKMGDSLADLHYQLLQAFNFANSHRSWGDAKKTYPVEYLRTLEVLFGVSGWHPHLHSVFIGDPELINFINVFVKLYKQRLLKQHFTVNEYTVVIEPWNGKINDMKDYLFKGMLEQELTGGNLKKSGKGKTFFELIDQDDISVHEYVNVMKGKRQYHHSKGFFKDVRTKEDIELLKDDKVLRVLFTVPKDTYIDMVKKGIALHLLNEYQYGGTDRAVKLLELYDCNTGFL